MTCRVRIAPLKHYGVTTDAVDESSPNPPERVAGEVPLEPARRHALAAAADRDQPDLVAERERAGIVVACQEGKGRLDDDRA